MRILRLILLIGGLLVWQDAVHAENAVMLKAYTFQETRNGYPMPKRKLSKGEIVKVLATHGAKADVVTSGGFTVSVHLKDLRILPETPAATVAAQKPVATPPPPVLQQPVVATLPPPVPSPSPSAPSPTPNQADGGGEKPNGAEPAHPGETGKREVPVRCSHVTKKGEQCSRMTTSPNGLCWQHGGD